MNNNTKSNFGKWGWATIAYCAVSYYIAAAMSTDTLNWYPAVFTEFRGWSDSVPDLCNTMAGIGGWIGIVAAIVFSIMAQKKGSRFMAVFGNVICGICCIIFAITPSITVFLVMIVILTFVGGNVQLNVVPNNIMNIWFPKKKGLALGWASMGLPICTATIILFLNAVGNPQTAYIIIGIFCFVIAGLSIVWVKNTPEEIGCTPDNEPIHIDEAMKLKAKEEEEAAKLTTAVLFRDRNTWLIGFGHGILWMTTIGLVSNFITKLVLVGTDANLAISMLTVAAVIGIIGSYFWGWLDQKIGTKNASLVYGVWYLIALLVMIFHNGSMAMTILAAIFVGFGIGGIGNLIPSIIGTCFGRFGFIRANKIIAPINTAVRSTALIIIGAIGVANLNKAYMVFFVCSAIAIVLIAFIKPREHTV